VQITRRGHWTDVRRSQRSEVAGEQTLRLLALRPERNTSRQHPRSVSQLPPGDAAHDICKVLQHCEASGQTGSTQQQTRQGSLWRTGEVLTELKHCLTTRQGNAGSI